jgi:hypothetical protein
MADETSRTSSAKTDDTSDAFKQTKDQALSPEEKHKNYLADVKRLHEESVIDSSGKTPRAG